MDPAKDLKSIIHTAEHEVKLYGKDPLIMPAVGGLAGVSYALYEQLWVHPARGLGYTMAGVGIGLAVSLTARGLYDAVRPRRRTTNKT